MKKSVLAIVLLVFIVAALLVYVSLRYPNYLNETITLVFSAVLAVATVVYVILTNRLVSETRETGKATADYVKHTKDLVYQTKDLVTETRKTREVQTDPKILVEVQPKYVRPPEGQDETILELFKNPEMNLDEPRLEFDLVVRNIGPGPAYDITPEILGEECVEFDKPDEDPITHKYENPANLKHIKKRRDSLSKGLSELRAFKDGISYIGPNDERSFYFWDVGIKEYPSIKDFVADYTVKIEVRYNKYPKEKRDGSEIPFHDTYLIDFSYLVERRIPYLVRRGPGI